MIIEVGLTFDESFLYADDRANDAAGDQNGLDQEAAHQHPGVHQLSNYHGVGRT